MKKNYETDDDYILDLLEKEEDRLLKQINDNLPNTIKFQFAQFLAIRNKIESINVNNAFDQGLYSRNSKNVV